MQVEGLIRLMEGEHVGPFNLGNPGEFTMLELAEVITLTSIPSFATKPLFSCKCVTSVGRLEPYHVDSHFACKPTTSSRCITSVNVFEAYPHVEWRNFSSVSYI